MDRVAAQSTPNYRPHVVNKILCSSKIRVGRPFKVFIKMCITVKNRKSTVPVKSIVRTEFRTFE